MENSKTKKSDEQKNNINEKQESASQYELILWRFKRHKLAMIGLAVILIFYISAFLAPFISPYNPTKRQGDLFVPPQIPHFISKEGGFQFRPFVYKLKQDLNMETFQRTWTEDTSQKYPLYFFVKGNNYKFLGLFETNIHFFGTAEGGAIYLFGTDKLGRDIFSRVLHAARISLSIGLMGVTLSFILGLIFGGISGYFGGTIDILIQRVIEILRSFPTIPLWMSLAAAIPKGFTMIQTYFAITVILSLIGWTGLARVVRGKLLSLRDEDFVYAARMAGASNWAIIIKHLLPAFTSHIIAALTLAIPRMILSETALSFLGLGLQPPIVSWGVLMQRAQNVNAVVETPWLMIPGVFVIITVLSFNFVGDGLRDAADPYSENV